MILNNIKEAVKFLPSLNLDLSNDRLTDFFRREQVWLVSHIIGEEIETLLNTPIGENQSDGHLDLRQHCQRIIAERALLTAIPEMDMQLTEAGFAVQDNENFSPASAQRVDRLIAKMPERIIADTDALVRYLMKNSAHVEEGQTPAPYAMWRDTDQFKYLTSAFLPYCEEFNNLAKTTDKPYEYFYAASALLPGEMARTADYYVSKEEVERLVGLYRRNDLMEVHRKAISSLKEVAVYSYMCNLRMAIHSAVCARDIMLENLDCFPDFAASPAASRKTINLDGGKTVNFL